MEIYGINNVPQSERAAYIAEISRIADELGAKPEWIGALLYTESSHNPKALNQGSGAVGLNQFLPSTLAQYDITPAEFLLLSRVDQLKYAEKYWKFWYSKFGPPNTPTEFALWNFYPDATKRPPEWKFPASAVKANPSIFKYGNTRDAYEKWLREKWTYIDFGDKASELESLLARALQIVKNGSLPILLLAFAATLYIYASK